MKWNVPSGDVQGMYYNSSLCPTNKIMAKDPFIMDTLENFKASQQNLAEYIKQEALISKKRHAIVMKKLEETTKESALLGKKLEAFLFNRTLMNVSLSQTENLSCFSYYKSVGDAVPSIFGSDSR